MYGETQNGVFGGYMLTHCSALFTYQPFLFMHLHSALLLEFCVFVFVFLPYCLLSLNKFYIHSCVGYSGTSGNLTWPSKVV